MVYLRLTIEPMERPSPNKVHFAPLHRQEAAIRRLLREKRYRNTTHFMRSAIDHYLARLGRPSLSEQAQQMAADFQAQDRRGARVPDGSQLQDDSRSTDEAW